MVQTIQLALDLGIPPIPEVENVQELPWYWVRLFVLYKKVRSIHERAAFYGEEAVPPRWMMFDEQKLEQWWADQDKTRRERLEER